MKLIHRLFALLIAAAYLGASVAAAALPVGPCPTFKQPIHSAHQHHSGQHHHPHHGSGTAAGECLKCCLGACLVAPGLIGPSLGFLEVAFIGFPVLYWPGSSAIIGQFVAPDPGPPKPIS